MKKHTSKLSILSLLLVFCATRAADPSYRQILSNKLTQNSKQNRRPVLNKAKTLFRRVYSFLTEKGIYILGIALAARVAKGLTKNVDSIKLKLARDALSNASIARNHLSRSLTAVSCPDSNPEKADRHLKLAKEYHQTSMNQTATLKSPKRILLLSLLLKIPGVR